MNRKLAALLLGLALSPSCATTRTYPDRPAPHAAHFSYDEGFKRGLMAGGWAGYRDLGRPYRRSYWNDEQYRRASEGFRPEYGSRAAYQDGFRAGYERGYRERREREHDSHRL